MKKLATFVALLLVGCTTTTNISSYSQFEGVIEKDVSTKRETYIYNFDGNSIYELWNHVYEYYQGGVKHIFHPLAECPIGSAIKIHEVYKEQKFDNPQTVKVKALIQCGGESFLVTYIWGLGNEIHFAPWESAEYQPRKTREIGN